MTANYVPDLDSGQDQISDAGIMASYKDVGQVFEVPRELLCM